LTAVASGWIGIGDSRPDGKLSVPNTEKSTVVTWAAGLARSPGGAADSSPLESGRVKAD
jgi:hypothetical protein